MTAPSPLAEWGAPPAQDRPVAVLGSSRGTVHGWLARNWVTSAALALVVANDYKFRRRSATETLSGGADVFILAEIAVYGLVAAYLVLSQRGLPRPARPPVVLLLTAGYVGLIVVSVSYSPFKALAAVRALETLVMFALVAAICDRGSRADLHRFAHGFLVLVAGSVVYGILVPTVATSGTQAGRFRWLQLHPVTTGVFVGVAALLALTYLLTRDRPRPGPVWPAWVYTVLLVLVTGGLLATRTRNAVGGAVIGVLVLLCLLYRGRRLVVALSGVAVLAVVGALLAGEGVVAYFVRGESAERLATLNSRTILWTEAYQAIAAQPVFGYGLSASRGLFLEETGLGGGHNAALNVGVDLGLLGLAVWACLLLAVVWLAARAPATTGSGAEVDRALILSVIGFLVTGGIFFEGLGAVANIAGNWLFLLVAWSVVLGRSAAPASRPAARALRATTPPTRRRIG